MEKKRFVTNLDPKVIEKLKIMAAKKHQPVNATIEELVNELFKKEVG